MALEEVAGDLILSADGRTFDGVTAGRRVAQRISITFLTPVTSNRYDTTIGVDWPDFFQKVRTSAERRAVIRTVILTHPEVVSVTSITENINKATRAADYAYFALLDTGEEIDGSVAIPLAST